MTSKRSVLQVRAGFQQAVERATTNLAKFDAMWKDYLEEQE